ncbi:MAG: hypothetical protein V4495_16210 [Pseudomonadota bacterium]
MKRKSILQIGTCLLLGCICIGIYTYKIAYPEYILTTYADHWPNAWNSDLSRLNHRQIVEKIGPPDEDLAAKDYQNWIKKESWGIFQLRILFRNCCDENSTPVGVEKIVRLKDRYKPIEYTILAREAKR